MEKRDRIITTFKILLTSKPDFKNTISVKTTGFLNSRSFRYKVINDDQRLNIVSNCIEDYLINNENNIIDNLLKLKFLKKSKRILEKLGFEIQLDPSLSSREVLDVIKAKPVIDEIQKENDVYYRIYYALNLSDGSVFEVRDGSFAGQEKYLEYNKKYVILSDDISEAIFLSQRMKLLSRKEAVKFINDPTGNLFPPDTDLNKFDLSEYDKRVGGFEILKLAKISEIISTGIEWYDKDKESIAKYKIKNISGDIEEIILDKDLVVSIISKYKNARDIDLINNQPIEDLPIDIGDGRYIIINKDNFQELVELEKKFSSEGKKTISKDTSSSNYAAVIQPVEHLENSSTFPNIRLLSEDLVPFLIDGFVLKKHQVEGVNWLLNSFYFENGGVVLADDMGLGKTLQLALFFVLIKNSEKIEKLKKYPKKSCDIGGMVVAPVILLENWNDEFKKFIKKDFLPEVLILHGGILKEIRKNDKNLDGKWWSNYDFIITNYKTFSKYQRSLLKIKFLINFFDESQNIKNPNTAQSRAARGVKSDFVVCVTGTPVENRLLDLWTQIDTINRKPRNPLGPEDKFIENYEKPKNGVLKVKEIMRFGQDDAVILRRDKQLLRDAKDLKNKIVLEPIYVEMTQNQITQEQAIVQKYKNKPLQIIHYLRYLYQHPHILNKNLDIEISDDELINESPKLAATIELLDKIKKSGEKVLVFTFSTPMQTLMKKVLDNRYKLNIFIINGVSNSKGSQSAKKMISKF